ncbi:flagellar hook-length control protein FliK [Desulfohalovibrio reitneri]|uniref:flagellar hook-length control protein FliK n=1 Tax=Desulfohalovibrio reitneri TaxID=1307759 RepID=UPI0004A6CF6E|nr:flagellar hook-length control protein FliK [Desulfohalovibrio reitneri]
MQIFPSHSQKESSGEGLFSLRADTRRGADSFAELMGSAASAVRAAAENRRERSDSETIRLDDSRQSARQAAEDAEHAARRRVEDARSAAEQQAGRGGAEVNREAFRRVEGSGELKPHEVKMTEDDFGELQGKLAQLGFSKEEIEGLREKLRSDEGLTWGEMVERIMAKSKELLETGQGAELSTVQKQQLDSFFQKIGFSADESADLMDDLANGKFSSVLEVVDKQISSLPQDKLLKLNPKGVHALVESLNLSKEASDKLKSLFKGEDSREVGLNELKNMLSEMRKEVELDQKQKLDLLREVKTAVEDALKAAIQKASGQQADEDSAKVIAAGRDKTAMEQFLGKKENGDAKEAGADAKNGGEADKGSASEELVNARKDGSKDQGHWSEQENQRQAEQKNAFDELWSKVEKEIEDPAVRQVFADARAEVQNARAEAKASLSQQARASLADQHSEEIFRQVREGMLKNMPGGGKQLTLELEPRELGRLTVALQVQGKEVKALIRTENNDVTRVLAEQMAQVKQTLEQQGMKVTEMDVQTGLSREDAMGRQWKDAEQHNLEQQRQAMAEIRTRMRNLRQESVRGDALQEQMAEIRRLASENGISLIA